MNQEYPILVGMTEITDENYDDLSAHYHCKVGEWALEFWIDSNGKSPEGGLIILKTMPTEAEIQEIARNLR